VFLTSLLDVERALCVTRAGLPALTTFQKAVMVVL
jgi:hypothetical protein